MCSFCGKDYIGSTARKLHDRAREYMLSARKKDDKTALGEYYRDWHAKVGKPSINFQIIKHQPDLLRLHIDSGSNSSPEVQPCVKSLPWNPRYWLPSLNSCSCNPKSPESGLTLTPALHSHQPSTNCSRHLPWSFSIKKPSKPHSDHRSIPDLLTDGSVARPNVLKSLPTIPPEIYYQPNRIYCVVSIVCCVYPVCRK